MSAPFLLGLLRNDGLGQITRSTNPLIAAADLLRRAAIGRRAACAAAGEAALGAGRCVEVFVSRETGGGQACDEQADEQKLFRFHAVSKIWMVKDGLAAASGVATAAARVAAAATAACVVVGTDLQDVVHVL